jgi:hypothetical protein
MGLSNPNEKGMINYKVFSFKCRDMIKELFSVKILADKATLIQSGNFKAPENLEEINITPLELFKVRLIFVTTLSYSRNTT